MKYTIIILLGIALFACDVQTGSESDQAAVKVETKSPYTVIATVADPKNQANIQRVVHTVLIDSSYLDKIESHIMPALVKKYNNRNMNQFLLYTENPVDIQAIKTSDIVEVYRAAKKGSVALINKSAADDGIVMFEY